ncbi:DnaJ homolog subfamily C member 4 [Mytilus galloprovincialis]|uniref:DnaJ homolog subfamily C member 4 n=1 Tax=Mytilus galloprovincialis TaxID=29158 RepID=A0A8B6DVB2_MYTGA|nr:DnaJ homolog subfamily C member 4 [Mytilus galloprovincialis]
MLANETKQTKNMKNLKKDMLIVHVVMHLTHYEILGVKPDASKDEIKKAYKKRSLELHPDVNQDDPKTHDKFVELKDAYGTLLKEDSREQYDKDLNMAFIYHRHKTSSEMTKRKFSEIPPQQRYVHPSQKAMSHEKEAFMNHYKDQQDKELGHMYMMMRKKKLLSKDTVWLINNIV